MNLNSTSKFLTALFFSATLILPMAAQAANLISIIVADTKDHTIGDSVKSDFDNMRNNMRTIAKFTELNPIEITLEGTETTSSNLLQRLDTLTIEQEDVVVFFFAGHGFHVSSEKSTTPWPNIYFSQNGQGIRYESIIKDLEKKNPKLLITIVDACNNLIPNESAPLRARTAMFNYTPDYVLEHNYKQLFLETSGTIKITSSAVGEFAWGGKAGGVFTRSFIDKLNRAVTSENGIDWQDILDETYDQTSQLTSNYETVQHPYYEVGLN